MGIIYYTGDYLAHHGIKGQKWGIRRFQNEDGTLTVAGKERYGSDKEQKKLADKIIRGRTNIRKTPQVRHAAEELKDTVKQIQDAKKKYENEVDKFYNNKKLVDEYSGKAADKFLKDYPDVVEDYRQSNTTPSSLKEMNDRDFIKWIIKNDSWWDDWGDYEPLAFFKQYGDKRANALNDADNKYSDSKRALSKASRIYANSFLGEYGNQKYTKKLSGFPKGITQTVADSMQNAIYYSSIEKHTGKKYL